MTSSMSTLPWLPSHKAAIVDEKRAREYSRIRQAMIDAEQNTILDLRDRGVIADDVMRRIQRDLDLESMLLETSEPVEARPDTLGEGA